MRLAIVTIATLMPFFAGGFIGAIHDPMSFEISAIVNAMCGVATSVALVTPVGSAIWLAWRFPFSEHRWSKLAIFGLLLFPSSLLTTTIVQRVSLFVRLQVVDVFNPHVSISIGESILDDALPDILYFITLFMALLIGRHFWQISIVRIGQPRQPPVRLTIQSMLTFTLIVSLWFFAMVHKVELDRGKLVKLDSPHGIVRFLDVLGIVTPPQQTLTRWI